MAESSKKTVRGRPFLPGQSGNPGGRPKKTQAQKDALEMIRDLAPDAAKRLREIILSNEEKTTDQLRAIEIVLDRAYGKTYANDAVDNTLAAAREILGGIRSAIK